MKNYILSILLCFIFQISNIYAQKDELIAIQSLEFLNQKFFINFNTMNEYIFIDYNYNNYVYSKYVDNDSLNSISRLRFRYYLKRIRGNEYEFKLIVGSEYKGTFEAKEKDGSYYFTNLKYIIRSN